jgi:hypothetical protein
VKREEGALLFSTSAGAACADADEDGADDKRSRAEEAERSGLLFLLKHLLWWW